ncbi:hypothetical protein [Brevundimonas sp.]|uniref:hypothetical protein n=1 Tax=Brevundimonas sp. TaxID=1871086 RepID=UPI003A917899|tara:strand:+ start:371 stop:709 length:339 start_codon:yes stop_codon:yes gene_type:complete
MLELLLMLVVPPQSPGDRLTVYQRQSPNGETILTTVPDCPNGRFQRAEGQADPGLDPAPLYRADGSVRGYLLLERSVGGCSRPISFTLPGSPPEIAPEPRPLRLIPARPDPR